MRELEKKSQHETWRMKAECTGYRNSNACGRYWELNSQDIVMRYVRVMNECDIEVYGFVCPKCNCFTEIRTDRIPEAILNRCARAEKERQRVKKSGWKRFFKF